MVKMEAKNCCFQSVGGFHISARVPVFNLMVDVLCLNMVFNLMVDSRLNLYVSAGFRSNSGYFMFKCGCIRMWVCG